MKIFSQPLFVFYFLSMTVSSLFHCYLEQRYLSEAAQRVLSTMVTLNREIFR